MLTKKHRGLLFKSLNQPLVTNKEMYKINRHIHFVLPNFRLSALWRHLRVLVLTPRVLGDDVVLGDARLRLADLADGLHAELVLPLQHHVLALEGGGGRTRLAHVLPSTWGNRDT